MLRNTHQMSTDSIETYSGRSKTHADSPEKAIHEQFTEWRLRLPCDRHKEPQQLRCIELRNPVRVSRSSGSCRHNFQFQI